MEEDLKVFDFHRIFIGDTPLIFLLEIVFRTLVMFGYATFLLRVLGKRGMGQFSNLEVAIIISFGSAVGEPMIGADVPILHGIVAVTVVSFAKIGIMRLGNKSTKLETLIEGSPNLIVENGVIKLQCLAEENVSKEDLLRALRSKDVEHLGQIEKAFFETTGDILVFFKSPQKTKPGLSVMPVNAVETSSIVTTATPVKEAGIYCCLDCGNVKSFEPEQPVPECEICQGKEWVKAEK